MFKDATTHKGERFTRKGAAVPGRCSRRRGKNIWELAIDAVTAFLSPLLSLTQCIWPPQSQLQAL